jgi:N-acyl-D-aspartate/D-glutamate deacylase
VAGFGPDGIGARSGAPFFGTSGVDEAEENDVHDVVIRNATVIDGLGNPRREGESLAVREGRIVAMGSDVGRGAEEIDAGGRVLCPGIVDLHTHFDAQLTWDSYATPSVGLGVTTVVAGNCGFTIAPCREQDRDRTLRNLTHVEGMSLDALREGVDWDFETYPEYLAMLERKGTVPNVACFVGHSSVRTYVLGDEASSRPATPSEVAEMKSIVRDAMEAGAIGFSTTTLEQHNGENGIPMPSRLADEHEMFELTGVLGDVGKGVFMLTKGMTSTIPWLEEIAARNGRPVMVAAMFVDPNDPERVFRELDEIGDAKGRGRELWGQVGCFPLGMEFCLAHPYPLEALLAWRPAMEAPGPEEFRRIVSDASFRDAIKAEARTTGVPLRFSYHQWDHMRIMEAAKPENRELVGRVVGDLAREAGKDPFDWYLDHCLDGEMDSLVDCHMFNVDEERVKDLLEHPHGVLGLSDAGAHLSFLCDAGFGLHMLGHWARDRADLTLEQAVQSVTSRLADVYRIKERGRLKVGACADLLLFDPETVGRGERVRKWDLPAGADRVDTPPIGVEGVWINGRRVVNEEGVMKNGVRPGRVLRDFAD